MTDSSRVAEPTDPKSTSQLPLPTGLSKAEFKDTPASVQFAECGICMLGGFLAWWCYSSARQDVAYLWAAGVIAVVTVIALAVVHMTYGNKTSLKHIHDSIVFSDRGHQRTIPFDQLQGFSAAWTDHYVNYVYSVTNVQFGFDVANSFKAYRYDSSARKGTLKYEQLEALQADMTRSVLVRMRETLLAESFVPWTSQLIITTAGIDYRKRGTGEQQLIPFSRLGKWEVSEGIFKLALDNERRPSITEHVNQTNFFPGLVLFAELQEEFGGREPEPSTGAEPVEPTYVAADN